MTSPAPSVLEAGLTVNGARLALDLSGAAYCVETGTLLVADLHLEKGSALAMKGVFLPPYDTRATLKRLEQAIARFAPERVVALGDSFHDGLAQFRIHGEDADRLDALVARVADWVWIEGNHDPMPPPRFGGRVTGEMALGPLTLRHEPRAGAQPGEVAGHLHPCAKVTGRGGRVRARCFLSDGTRLILPAFGAFTGGLNLRDPAYADCFAALPDAYVIGRAKVYRVPGRRCLPD